MELILYVQLVLSILMLIAIILPVFKNSFWIFRILEYPRFQIWLIVAIICVTWVYSFQYADVFFKVVAIALFAGLIYLSYKIWPYTPAAKRQIKTVRPGRADDQIKIYTANVFQDNREYSRILQQIKNYDPDLVVLVETDKEWKAAMDELLDTHPRYIGQPLSNTYGMLLYSRYEIDGRVQMVVERDIPSIEACLKLPSGQEINIWAVHPKPPVPGESYDSRAKDSEIMKVAFKAEKSELPVIVMGDFNDVAWSNVTELFQKTARLLDPRRGRGFYSTFSTHSMFVRFPLDYIFCSNDFGLISMKRMPRNGSDHFAILTHLQYNPALRHQQDVKPADPEERKEAREKEKAA